MEDLKWLMPAVAGVAVLLTVAMTFTWLVLHPLVVIAAGVSVFLLVRHTARRNRV